MSLLAYSLASISALITSFIVFSSLISFFWEVSKLVENSVQKSISDISHFKKGIVICPPSKIETRVPPSEPTI